MSNETLIKGLVSAMAPAVQAVAALGAAKEAAFDGGGKSIRAVSALLAKTNTPLDKVTIEEVSTAVATSLANGNPSTLKVRKSETKLLLESRAVLPDLIKRIDQVSDDTETAVNLRAEVLKGCRVIRKDPLILPSAVADTLREKLTATKSDFDNFARQHATLSKTPHLQQGCCRLSGGWGRTSTGIGSTSMRWLSSRKPTRPASTANCRRPLTSMG
jgi:hypothetical protein